MTSYVLARAMGLWLAIIGAMLAGGALAQSAPDLEVKKVCTDAPNIGQYGVNCRIDITNLGNHVSAAPFALTDMLAGSSVGVTFAGQQAGSSVPCQTPAGGLPSAIHCNANLAFGVAGSVYAHAIVNLGFIVPPGATLKNCVSATQGTSTTLPADSNATNNTNICTTFTRPLGRVVDKHCETDANHVVTCIVKVTNNGVAAIPAGTPLTDTLTGVPTNTAFLGASGLSCPPPATYTQPLACTTQQAIPGNGGMASFTFRFRTAPHVTFRNCAAVTLPSGRSEGCATGVSP